MAIIVLDAGKRIGKDGERLGKRDAMLRTVRRGLSRIPLESQGHDRNVLDERDIRLTGCTKKLLGYSDWRRSSAGDHARTARRIWSVCIVPSRPQMTHHKYIDTNPRFLPVDLVMVRACQMILTWRASATSTRCPASSSRS